MSVRPPCNLFADHISHESSAWRVALMCHSSGGGIVLYRPLTETLLEGVGWDEMVWYGSGKHDDINKVVAKEGNFQEISILLFVCLVLVLLIGFLFFFFYQ